MEELVPEERFLLALPASVSGPTHSGRNTAPADTPPHDAGCGRRARAPSCRRRRRGTQRRAGTLAPLRAPQPQGRGRFGRPSGGGGQGRGSGRVSTSYDPADREDHHPARRHFALALEFKCILRSLRFLGVELNAQNFASKRAEKVGNVLFLQEGIYEEQATDESRLSKETEGTAVLVFDGNPHKMKKELVNVETNHESFHWSINNFGVLVGLTNIQTWILHGTIHFAGKCSTVFSVII